ncbi:MAG: hypothetical protein LBG76_08710 [Treponema sp.]|jgi:hypothetical protein|nr:hypothetical protein [Treponema sp.]
MKAKHGLLFSWAVMLVAAVFSFSLLGCDSNTDSPVDTLDRHLVGGKINGKEFYADEKGGDRAVTRSGTELEGQIDSGNGAIPLTGTYDNVSGKFTLAAMSPTLGVGYSIEGSITDNGAKDLKGVVKTKNGEEWTETEASVVFDSTAQVSASAAPDAGTASGLPAAWTGVYQLPTAVKNDLITRISGIYYRADTAATPATGLGERLVDSIFFSVTPWGVSLITDFEGIDTGIDEFTAELPANSPSGGPSSEYITQTKILIHQALSKILADYYFSFLEVTENSGAYDALAFKIVTVDILQNGNSTALGEKKYYTKFKITLTDDGRLKLVQVNGLSVNESVSVPLFQYDATGNIIPVTDSDGQPVTSTAAIAASGVAATAALAKAATDFTEITEAFSTNVLILAK